MFETSHQHHLKGHFGGRLCIPKPKMARQDKPAAKSFAADPQHKVYYFMCRFTCSRCWKTAIELASYDEFLRDSNVGVVLVGTGPYLRQATCLAAGLCLPFRLIVDDQGVLRRRFLGTSDYKECHRQAIVLVDNQGSVRYRQRVSSPGGRLKLASLLAVARTLPKVEEERAWAAGRLATEC